jgi:hypothetical protein
MTWKARQAVALQQRESDLRAVLDTPEGRRFVWRLLETSNLHGGSYTGEAFSTAFNEGTRAVAMGLLQEAQRVAPNSYVAMVTEAAEASRTAMLTLKAEELERQKAAAEGEDIES